MCGRFRVVLKQDLSHGEAEGCIIGGDGQRGVARVGMGRKEQDLICVVLKYGVSNEKVRNGTSAVFIA